MRILWSSEISIEMLTPRILEDYKEEFACGVYTEKDIPKLALTFNQNNLNILKSNSNKLLEGNIIVIADLERWSKRTLTLAYLNTNQLSKVFNKLDDGTDIRWFTDNRNLRGDEVTNKGVNHYIFREIREGKNINKLKQRIQNGEEVTSQLLNYYTKTLLNYFE